VRSRRPLLLFVVALAIAAPAAQDRSVHEAPRFRSRVDVVSVTMTVRDAEGHLVTDLPRDAFEVYEDGNRQAITQFTSERIPISLGMLLDVSDSMYGRRMQDARSAVERFLFELLDPADEFFILAFNHQPSVLTGWTKTTAVIRRALDGLRAFGGTAIYDAVLASLPIVETRSEERTALVLISDGADTASDATLRHVRSALLRSDAFVYAIAINPPESRPINTQVNPTALREITDGSGGRTEVVRDTADLVAATSSIAEELNHQYVLGYNSPHGADGKYHAIRVRVRDRNHRVRARNGYVAE
jgi:Ca-activated chloride channel homolog